MFGKHFITGDSVSSLVGDALESILYQHPDLALDRENKVIFHQSLKPNHVAIISGGGAGHEPAHALYVGNGMLSAAVSGNTFASPSVPQIVSALRRVTGPAGAILIVKNYTGDIFHFYQAAEKARASYGLRVEVLAVGDDAAVGRKKGGKVGRRGLAGTILVHKVVGALAASGKSIEECLRVGREVVMNLVTVGISLDHVHVPGQPESSNQNLGRDEVELGMGIHNEPGVKRLSPQPRLQELLDIVLKYSLDENDADRRFVQFQPTDDVILLVNHLGGLSVLELSAITIHVIRSLEARNVRLAKVYSGTFMTSLNGEGFSITLLRSSLEMLSLLESSTDALAWKSQSCQIKASTPSSRLLETLSIQDDNVQQSTSGPQVDFKTLSNAFRYACKSAIEAEPSITKADTTVGDGDCGTTLKRGAEAVLQYFECAPGVENTHVLHHLLHIAEIIEKNMDGTSGAIYALFFNGLCSSLRKYSSDETMSAALWTSIAKEALAIVQNVTPARTGDRTLMDALEPFIGCLQEGLDAAVSASEQGMQKTKGMSPAFGRAVYVNEEGWETVPDPGAMSVVALVKGLQDAVVFRN